MDTNEIAALAAQNRSRAEELASAMLFGEALRFIEEAVSQYRELFLLFTHDFRHGIDVSLDKYVSKNREISINTKTNASTIAMSNISDHLSDALIVSSSINFALKNYGESVVKFKEAIQIIEEQTDTDEFSRYIKLSKAYIAYAQILSSIGLFEKSLSAIENAYTIIDRQIWPKNDFYIIYTDALALQLVICVKMGDKEKAKRLCERIIYMQDKIELFGKNQNLLDSADCLNNIGSSLAFAGYKYEAKDILERSVRAYMSAYTSDKSIYSSRMPSAMSNLSAILSDVGESDRALLLAEYAMGFYESSIYSENIDLNSRNSANFARALVNYSRALHDMGRTEAAIDALNRAASKFEHLARIDVSYVSDYVTTAVTLLSLIPKGSRSFGSSLVEKSEFIFSVILESNVGNHSGIALALNNLASLLIAECEYSHARQLLWYALDIYRKIGQYDSFEAMAVLSNIGNTSMKIGNFEEAISNYQDAHSIYGRIPGVNHGLYIANANNLASAFEAKGDFPAAVKIYNEALEEGMGYFGDKHEYTQIIKSNLQRLRRPNGAELKYHM